MALNIYLYFDGNCRAAFDFYQSVFGGDFAALQTFGDGPAEMDVPQEAKSKIMHVSLPLGDAMLMGSDTLPGSIEPLIVGTNFSIAVPAESRTHCDELFAKLSAGGQISMALQETFWGAYFGSCRDQYDINWMFNFDLEQDVA